MAHEQQPNEEYRPDKSSRSVEQPPQERPQIWVGSLLDYNNGILYGAWLDAARPADELETDIRALLAGSPTTATDGDPAEEWGIFDFEGFGGIRLGESAALSYVSRLAQGIAGHGPAFAAWVEISDGEDSLGQFEEAYLGHYDSLEAYAEELLEDLGPNECWTKHCRSTSSGTSTSTWLAWPRICGSVVTSRSPMMVRAASGYSTATYKERLSCIDVKLTIYAEFIQRKAYSGMQRENYSMTPQDAIRLGAFLRQKREDLGLSQRELARRAGIADVVRIEQGALLNPRTDSLRAIAGALGLTLSDLLAIANYVEPEELPTLSPYLRAKYGDLSEEAIQEVDQFLARLRRKHGVHAPVDHEDER